MRPWSIAILAVSFAAALAGCGSSSGGGGAPAVGSVRFTSQPPASVTAGATFSVAVEVLDAGGARVTATVTAVTLAIGTNPGGGTLTGGGAQATVNGVATFSGLSIDKAGTAYTLAASSTGLTGATSGAFNIVPGTATALAFTTQPAGAVLGTAFATQPVVEVQDALGNRVTSATPTVTASIGTNPASGTLAGNRTVTASAGVATFSGLSIDNVGAGYTLVAAASGLSSATSNPFNVAAGAPVKLAFSTQPGGANSTDALSQQPVVEVLDASNNRVSVSVSVTLSIATNPNGGTLSGTLTKASSAVGLATFSGLSIDKAGIGYQIAANASGLQGATSTAFNISVGPATKLAVTTQPAGGRGGIAFATPPVVEIQDAGGNRVTTDNTTVVTVTAFPSSSIAVTVAPKTSQHPYFGVGEPDGYVLDNIQGEELFLRRGVRYTFSVSVGSAHPFYITTDASGGIGAPGAFSTGVTNNFVTSGSLFFTPDLTAPSLLYYQCSSHLKMGWKINVTGTATPFIGTTSVTAVNGTFLFNNLGLNPAGSFLLQFTAGSFTVNSNATLVTLGNRTKLAVTQQPAGATNGQAFATQPIVEVRDGGDNTMTSETGTPITASIKAATGTGGAVLSGANPTNTLQGEAKFTNLSINLAGTGYVLSFTDGTFTVESAAFNVN